jgi:YD repeat-containing protein
MRQFNWGKSGRLIGVKDNKRGSSSYHYDPRDQVSRITRQTGLNTQINEQYSYDSLMNLVQSNGEHHQYENGEVKSIGRSSYRHDNRGRVVEKRVVKSGFRPKTWFFRWDVSGNVKMTHLGN